MEIAYLFVLHKHITHEDNIKDRRAVISPLAFLLLLLLSHSIAMKSLLNFMKVNHAKLGQF